MMSSPGLCGWSRLQAPPWSVTDDDRWWQTPATGTSLAPLHYV